MKLHYGNANQTVDVLPNISNIGNLSLGTKKNAEADCLRRISNAWLRFKQAPNPGTLQQLSAELKVTTNMFRRRKSTNLTTIGNTSTAITNYCDYLWGRTLVMTSIESKLLKLDWKKKAIWAEIYNSRFADKFGVLSQYITDLERECDITSQWAKMPPNTMDAWSQIGKKEADALAAWPRLPPETVYKVKLFPSLGIGANDWPRWEPNPGFARKGLFCHSSAAIAAHTVYSNHTSLVQRNYRIRSIDLIHQQPSKAGQMSHWWLCVNRPTSIEFEGKTVTMDQFRNVSEYLAISGGFVVDIWGALFKAMKGAANSYNREIAVERCTWDKPNSGFLGESKIKVFKRWTNPNAAAY